MLRGFGEGAPGPDFCPTWGWFLADGGLIAAQTDMTKMGAVQLYMILRMAKDEDSFG